MRCGTVFKDDPASDDNETVFEDLERLACQLDWRAKLIRVAITHCRMKQSTEGLTEMVAYAFNAQQYTPSFGGGGDQLPPGDYDVVAVNSGQQESNSKQGGFMFFELTPTAGPLAGRKQTLRFNLHNTNPQTVKIANEQLTALCHAVGRPQGFNDTQELHMIPFKVRIDWQKGQEPTQEKPQGGYTEVRALFTAQGQEIGKGNGPVQTQQQPVNPNPPANVQPQGNGWGGQPQGGQGQQPQQGQQGGQPMQGQQGGGQWGGQPQQGQQPQQGGQWGGQPQQGGQAPIDNNVQPNQGGQPQGQQGGQWGGQGGQPQGGQQPQQGGWGGAPQQGGQQGGWGAS